MTSGRKIENKTTKSGEIGVFRGVWQNRRTKAYTYES